LTTPGSYIFALEVTDDDGARASDTMRVTVNPAPTYSCTAPLPVAFASYYTGDDTGLSANTPGSYSAANTGAKCEWVCNTAYWWNGSACVLPDLTAVSTVPANGASFTNLVSIAFTGEARNSATAPVTQGGWADLEIDTDNDGVANMNWNAYPPTYSSRVGSFLQNETKSLSRTLAAGTLAAGSYRYRFHVDTDGAGVAESNESNNTSAWRSFTVTNPVNGVCGPAARTYGFNESAFTGALCSVGSASPAAPAFPAQGATTNWQCLGQFGGSNVACSAPRDNPPPPEVTVGDCTIALEGSTCTRNDVTWNLEAFAGPYNIRNITNSSQISGTASTSAAIAVGAGRRLTLNYGLNTINALAGGVSRASDTANASCNTAAGHFWHSLLGTPVCKAPPSINITAPSVGSGTLVRSGDTVTIEYEVNANYNVACTITGLSGGGPGTYNHVGAPGWVAATPSVTGALTAAQVVRIDCGVVGIPSSYNSEEIRIDVIPPYQET
jgi:hypothetical protein